MALLDDFLNIAEELQLKGITEGKMENPEPQNYNPKHNSFHQNQITYSDQIEESFKDYKDDILTNINYK